MGARAAGSIALASCPEPSRDDAMITHMVHAAYEMVEKAADLAAEEHRGPDENLGRLLVWAFAVIGTCITGWMVISSYGTEDEFGLVKYDDAFTSDHLLVVVIGGIAGAAVGVAVGMAIWLAVVWVTVQSRSSAKPQ
jgi:hypothetical protein